MLIKVCLLFLSVGVYASYAESSLASTTEDELFGQLHYMFPRNFISRYPEESEYFTGKILVYIFFNLFSKYLGEHEPMKFWSKFNHNDFNRVAIDAAFYEYLTKFADKKMKQLIFNPVESTTSSPEDIAIDRIGDYLDSLSGAEVAVDQSETRSQVSKAKDYITRCIKIHDKHQVYYLKCIEIHELTSNLGISGIDYPNYCDIPKTSFTCANKLVPGIYADTETRCQVFHVCWPHRMDSYLCPIGTTFNQTHLTCDFWHESDCSLPQTEPPVVLDDETRTTSERPSTSTPEMDMPEYDGTCLSLMKLQWFDDMKFLPAKCKVADLKPSTQETTSKYEGKKVKEMFLSIAQANEIENKMEEALRRLVLKMKWPTRKHDSEVVKVATESTSQNGGVDTISEEQIYHLSTKMPSDNQGKFPPRIDSGFVEKSVFKTSSRENGKYIHPVGKSAILKPSKPSEETIKRVFYMLITTLKLGGKMLNDGLLPFVEQMVLDSHRKKSNRSRDQLLAFK